MSKKIYLLTRATNFYWGLNIPFIAILLLCSMACGGNPAPKNVDLRTMLDLISENIVAAEEEYKNQHVQLSGKISGIEKNKVRLIPIGSDMFQISGADCFFAGDEKKHIASLRKGDMLTVTGRVKNINTILVNTVKMQDCRLSPTPAADAQQPAHLGHPRGEVNTPSLATTSAKKSLPTPVPSSEVKVFSLTPQAGSTAVESLTGYVPRDEVVLEEPIPSAPPLASLDARYITAARHFFLNGHSPAPGPIPDTFTSLAGCKGLEKLIPQIKHEVFTEYMISTNMGTLLGAYEHVNTQPSLRIILEYEVITGIDEMCQKWLEHFLNNSEEYLLE